MYRVFDPAELVNMAIARAAADRPMTMLTASGLGGVAETLYFSNATGLLIRRDTTIASPLGPIVERVEYADYRLVNGVRIPFVITSSGIGQRMRFVFRRIEFGSTLAVDTFRRPDSQAGARCVRRTSAGGASTAAT